MIRSLRVVSILNHYRRAQAVCEPRGLKQFGPCLRIDVGVVAAILVFHMDRDAVGLREVVIGKDAFGGAGGDGGADGREEQNVLCVGEEFFEVVGDGDDGWAIGLLMEASESGENGFARGEVQAGSGFVEDEQFGFADEGTGDEGAHALAGGEREIELGRLRAKSDLFKEVAGVVPLGLRGVDVADGEGGKVAGDGDIEGGHFVVEGVDGGGFDDSHSCAEGRDGGFAEGFSEECDGAFLRPEVGAGEAEEGGFAAAVGTEYGGDLFGLDGPGDVGEDGAVIA